MNFRIPNTVLAPLLRRLTAIVPGKPMIPSHASIKIVSSAPRTLKFYTYSPLITTEGTLTDVDVSGAFEFGTSVGLFTSMVSSLPKDAMIEFTLTDNQLLVKAERSNFRLNIFTEDVFLPPRSYEGLPFIPLNMKLFVDSLKKVSFCVEAKHDREERTVICINSDHFVATDGHRMSIYPNKLFKTPYDILVSTSAVDRLQKLYDKSSDNGVFAGSPSATEIMLGCQGVYSSTRLSTGNYPNYRSVIPSGPHTRCLVNRSELLESFERVMVLMDDDDLKKVSMTLSENRLDLYTTDKKYGDGLESLGCESPGFSETLLVTGTFITEALRNYTTEKVVFELRPSGSPQRTQPLILTDGEHVNVIMPLRV